MLRIRLQRSGRRKRANYRLVVAEHSAPIKGRYVALVGTYDPLIDKHGLVFDADKIQEWIKKGAKPTNTVARLLKGAGVKDMDRFIVEMKDKKVKNPKEVPEEAAPAAEAAPAEEKAEETPAEPAPEEKPAEAPAADEKAEEAPAEEKPVETPAPEAAPAEEKAEEKPAEEAPAEEKSE